MRSSSTRRLRIARIDKGLGLKVVRRQAKARLSVCQGARTLDVEEAGAALKQASGVGRGVHVEFFECVLTATRRCQGGSW